jgi:sterol desaturase/sphingolipid hydroxylase (fatty acid hydroxylase superfamily)
MWTMEGFSLDWRVAGPVIAGLAVLALLAAESGVPLRERKYPLRRRAGANLCLWAVAFAVNIFVVRRAAEYVIGWAPDRRFGLLNLVALPVGVQFALGFLLMDFTFYYWHRVNHEIRLLWRFHNVHHVDPDVDVLTAFRFHFGEILFSAGFRVAQLGLIGVAPLTFVVYEFVFQYATMFHHSNVRIPVRFERWLNKVVVTPRMHGIHHSIVREERDSNYSVIFRWWDTVSRSLRLNIPQSEVIVGVPAYLQEGDNKLWRLMILPFIKQKRYGRLPDGTRPKRESTRHVNRALMVE